MAIRVVLIGSFWPASLESSYKRAFEKIGVEVTPIDPEALLTKTYGNSGLSRRFIWPLAIGKISKQVSRAIQSVRPDLTFIIKGTSIPPSLLTSIQPFSGKLVNFNPDSPWESANSSNWLMQSIPIYDLHLTWSKDLMGKFGKAGAKRVECLPFAHDPELHAPVDNPQKKFDAVFVGTYEPLRDETLAILKPMNIAIWGNGWDQSTQVPKEWIKGAAIYGKAASEAMSQGVVNINILRKQNAGSHNMRTYEIPATGNLMLTTRSKEQQALFDEGETVLMFSSLPELRDKVEWAQRNHELAVIMGERARNVVLKETYEKRARKVLEFCGLG